MKNEKKDYTVIIIVCGIIVSLLAVILGPIFIDEAFQKTASNKWLAVDWEAKDALNYYGTALAFLGTAVFSALALWQNHIFKKANEEHERKLELIEKIKDMPFFSFNYRGKFAEGEKIHIKNISGNIAIDAAVTDFCIEKNGTTEFCAINGYLGNIDSDKTADVFIETDKMNNANCKINFKITFTDKFGERHFYKIEKYNKKGYDIAFFKCKPIDVE